MAENRPSGRRLGKIASYLYAAMGILMAIVTLCLNNPEGSFALIQRGTSIELLAFAIVIYFILAAATYLLSTRYENDDALWKTYVAIVIVNIIVVGFNIISIIFSILVAVAAYDIRKELI